MTSPSPSEPPRRAPQVPPDIAAYYARKRRFETQTPIVGIGCFTIIATIGFAIALGPLWYLALPIAILGFVMALYQYRAAQHNQQQWEDELRDHHRGR